MGNKYTNITDIIDTIAMEKIGDKGSNKVNHYKIVNDITHNKIGLVLKKYESSNMFSLNNDLTDIIETNEDIIYGLDPSFGADKIKEILNEYFFNAINNKKYSLNYYLKNIIIENHTLFNLDKSILEKGVQADNTFIIYTLYKKCLLQMALNFKVTINIEDNKLCNIIYNKINISGYNCNIYVEKSNNTISFIGFIPDYIFKILEDYSISVINNKLYLTNNSSSTPIELFPVYETRRSNMPYYSGVFPRVKKLELKNETTTANILEHWTFYINRTTYATVDMFDNHLVNNHIIFSNMEKKILNELFLLEDIYLNKLYNSDNSYAAINDYLEESFNTHTLAVSALLETKDKYLVYSVRSDNSIDSQQIYCSANGQSEIKNKDVDMYSTSSYEDYPTITYDDEYRMILDFEFSREVIAELGIAQFSNKWDYYGFSYLSINNSISTNEDADTSSKVTNRRMHFNVLAYNEIFATFEEVNKSYMNAIEKFESSKLLGLKLNMYNNTLDKITKTMRKMFSLIANHKDILFIIALLISMIINSKSNIKEIINFNNLTNTVNSTINIAIIIISCVSLYSLIHKKIIYRKILTTVSINTSKSLDEQMLYLIKKLKTYKNYNPTAIAGTLIYLIRKNSDKNH